MAVVYLFIFLKTETSFSTPGPGYGFVFLFKSFLKNPGIGKLSEHFRHVERYREVLLWNYLTVLWGEILYWWEAAPGIRAYIHPIQVPYKNKPEGVSLEKQQQYLSLLMSQHSVL